MEPYIKNIAGRWRKEIAAASDIKYVFSPYITSYTAESVLSKKADKNCEIYTLFSAENFSSKASSLKTIKKLATLGHKIFHLPNLHAKIFLIPGVFSSIGSQNLTHRGTKSKEASIAIQNKEVILQIERQISPWLADRIPITAEMVSDMEKFLGEIEPLYEEARLAAEEADRKVFAEQVLREAEASRLAEEMEEERLRTREAEERRVAEIAEQQHLAQEAALQRQRYVQLQVNIQLTAKSLSNAYGVVRVVESGDSWNSSQTKSLMALNKRKFTSWSINNRTHNLVKGKRYLFLLQNSGKIGWARVMETRISFVGRGINLPEGITVNGTVLSVSINGDWNTEPRYGRNIYIEVKDTQRDVSCVVSAWFNLMNFEILKVESPENVTSALQEQSSMVARINNNIPEFTAACLKHIVTPFVYKKNLYGANAEEFFNKVGSHFELKAALIGANPILIGKYSG